MFTFLTSTWILGSITKYIVFFGIALIGMIAANFGAFIFATAVGVSAGLMAASGGLLATVGMLIALIILLIIIWNALKTCFALLKAFTSILLLTIFGPLQITAGVVIPNFGFGQWIKSFISALSTFVVTGALLLFAFIFLYDGIKFGLDAFFGDGSFGDAVISFGIGVAGKSALTNLAYTGSATASWPPLLGMGSGTMGVGLIFLGVSFVLFTLIPKTTELVQSLLSGKPFAYGTALGETFAPAKLVWDRTGGPIMKAREERVGRQREADIVKQINQALPKKKSGDWVS